MYNMYNKHFVKESYNTLKKRGKQEVSTNKCIQ